MRFSFYKRSFIFCFCTILPSAATVTQVSAQSQQQQPALLALKTCAGELRVFDDGTVVESRRGKTTQRRLSESRMQKLREVIARRPCVKEWKETTPAPPVASKTEVKLSGLQLSSTYGNDCVLEWLSFGGGLDEIQVTIRSPEGQIGPFPVYVVCDGAKESYKKSARRHYQRLLKPVWHRFIADISKAVGSKSFLKGCDCWQS